MVIAPAPVLAQESAPVETRGPEGAVEDEEIIVTGQRLPGSVGGTIPPELQLTPGDIRSYGVSSLSDLIAELSPQTASGRGGAAVVLLNGKRISSFSEIRDIPTEAIVRIEILPEEAALRFGYRADQKVVNVILRQRFRAFSAEIDGAMPTEGGQINGEIETSLLRIRQNDRLNLAINYERSSALTEDERDIIADSPRRPFDILGNITAPTLGAEIDPALSALYGEPITVAGLPASAATTAPALAGLAPTANVTNIGRYRTLLPQTDALTMNAVLARTVFGDVSATVNGSFSYNESDSRRGLAGVGIALPADSPFSPFAGDTMVYRYLDQLGALGQQSRDYSGHLGLSLNGTKGGWRWTLTANYDRSWSRTRTENGIDIAEFQNRITALDPTVNPFAAIDAALLGDPLVDRARSRSSVGNLQLVVNGTLATLPAGPLSATVTLGGETTDLSARSTRSTITSSANLSRDIASGQVSFDVPLASRREGFLTALGELSANFNLGYDRPSDFGTLQTIGYGLSWTPIKPINLIVSVTEEERAPTIQQLGNPLIQTSGSRVFDYVRGETVDITRTSGGNPFLSEDDRRVIRLGATIKPLSEEDLTFTANYINSRIRNPIASFPTATATIEAAFPERFMRDASGRLIGIDSRPINFARQDHEEIRWGINFSKRISSPPPSTDGRRRGENAQPNLRELLPPGGERPPSTPQAGQSAGEPGRGSGARGGGERAGAGPGGGPRGPGGGFGRGPGGRGTRLQLAAYHTINLQDTILIANGGPRLDLLKGDAIGSSGGQPRNRVQVQAGITHNGLGARLTGAWQEGTTVFGGPGTASELRFSSLATLNLRLFADLGQQRALVEKIPFFRGARLTFSVTNLFNERIHVRDANGDTPVNFQPGYLDPLGRSVRISFRKLFFPPRPSGPPRS